MRLNLDGMDRVLIHVPQWAGPIPMSLGSTAMSELWGYDSDCFLDPEFLS